MEFEIPPKHTRRRVVHPVEGESKTIQSARDATDVNLIVQRHTATGRLEHLETREPKYGDFSLATSLLAAVQLVDAANDAFDALPALVRKAADNDPVRFAEMIASEEGTQALVDAGLKVSGVEPTPKPPLPGSEGAPAPALPGGGPPGPPPSEPPVS